MAPPEPKIPADLLRAVAHEEAIVENDRRNEAADVAARYAEVQAQVAAFVASKDAYAPDPGFEDDGEDSV